MSGPGYQACRDRWGYDAANAVAGYIDSLRLGYEPSPEQWLFLGWIVSQSGSCVLEAVAGSGKTSSLILALGLMKGSVFLGAFNRDIAAELKARIPPADQWRIQAATMHSAGLGAIKRAGRKPRTESGKLRFLLKDMQEDLAWDDPAKKNASSITKLVSLAKQHGFDCVSHGKERFPRSDDCEAWLALVDHFSLEDDLTGEFSVSRLVDWAHRLLEKSKLTEHMIDFDDMLWLPLLLNYPFQPYNWVLLDEAQDTNVVRREMAFRMLAGPGPGESPGAGHVIAAGTYKGRLIAVGDRHQAIYGFTGADARALDNIRSRANATTLPLSVSWRCARNIVCEAQQVVDHIKAAPTAPEGTVSSVEFDEFFIDRLRPGDALLCRLNRPNVATAIACLRADKPARIVGRDLGQRLLAHAKRAAPDRPDLLSLGPAVDSYQQAEIARLIQRSKESSIPFFEDEIEALMLLMDKCLEEGKQSYADLESLCNWLFINPDAQAGAVIFSSVHKAKGLEWPRVYILGRSDYMPFFMAKQDWELEQETNLIYVAITRAKRELIYVEGVRSAIDSGVHRAQKRREEGEPRLSFSQPTPTGTTATPPLPGSGSLTDLDRSILDDLLDPEGV